MDRGVGPRVVGNAVRDGLRTQLWPLPMLGVLLAVALGIGLPQVDEAIGDGIPSSVGYLFGGGPGSARTVLDAIASSMVTVTALTFSLTVVTLQLASSQYSPRLLRTFTRDLVVQGTLALFLGTFVYALTVLRTVRSADEDRSIFVPNISVTVAFGLAIASVLSLVLFLAHLARTIRVESMMRSVHDEGGVTIGRVLEESSRPTETLAELTPTGTRHLVTARRSGFLVDVDEEALRNVAGEAACVVVVDRTVGSFIVAGTPVAALVAPLGSEPPEDRLLEKVAGAVRVSFERTAQRDVGLALRLMTDVAAKALSPGVNDPTTAVHALGHSSALLCDLVVRRLGPRVLRDQDDTLRVVLAGPEWADLLELAVDQPARHGAGEPAVMHRLFVLLQEVAWVAPAHHRAAIERQLARLRRAVAGEDLDPDAREDLERSAEAVEAALTLSWSPPIS